MKNSKNNNFFIMISIVVSILVVLLHVNSEYPNGLGLERAAFDYVWFGVYENIDEAICCSL